MQREEALRLCPWLMERAGRRNSSKQEERRDISPTKLPGQRPGREHPLGEAGKQVCNPQGAEERGGLSLQVGAAGRPEAWSLGHLHVDTIFGALWRPLRGVPGAFALPGPQPVALSTPSTLTSSPGTLPIAPPSTWGNRL